jgi:hypothetical protein
MDLKTYNALMGAAAIGLRTSIKERTSIEFNFSIQLKMQIGKLSKEDAIEQTAKERLIGMLTAFITSIIGMICCLYLAFNKEESELVLLVPILLGYGPLVYASFFSNWWHKTKVINK